MELKFWIVTIEREGKLDCETFVIKVEKEGRSLVFGFLVLVLLWFLTRNGICLNLFAYDSFLKILCLGYFDQGENSLNEYEVLNWIEWQRAKKLLC